MARHVSELDLLDLQKQGQQLYGQKKFEEALKCFDQAISSAAKVPISLLSNRAATYMRLNRLKPALRDGRRMIEQDKGNSSGYFRTGQILQVMENPSKALDIYRLGLRNVSPSDVQAKKMQDLQDQMTKRCSPPKFVDPMVTLPVELLELVIGYLTFKEIMPLLRVSKAWKSVLTSLPRLWANLDFSSTRRSVKLTAVSQYVKNAHQTCCALRIPCLKEQQELIIKHVVSRCKDLKELTIMSGSFSAPLANTADQARNLKIIILSSSVEIDLRTVLKLLTQCTSLERAEFPKTANQSKSDIRLLPTLPNLHTLVLNNNDRTSGLLRLDQIVESIQNIRSLTLRSWRMADTTTYFSTLAHLEYLDISDTGASLFPKLPPSLRSLSMSNTSICGQFETPLEPQSLPNLSTLILDGYWGYPQYKVPDLSKILEGNNGRLKILSLNNFFNMIDSPEIFVVPPITSGILSGVEKLNLVEMHIDDSMATQIAQHLLHLKSLDLSRTRVTGVGVKALLTALSGKLQWLGLDDCFHTSLDAVELAQSMGVKVSYRFSDAKKGTKIRNY